MNSKWHNINPIEGMAINIREDGRKEVWSWIEGMADPYKRVRYRSVYLDAIKLIGNNEPTST